MGLIDCPAVFRPAKHSQLDEATYVRREAFRDQSAQRLADVRRRLQGPSAPEEAEAVLQACAKDRDGGFASAFLSEQQLLAHFEEGCCPLPSFAVWQNKWRLIDDGHFAAATRPPPCRGGCTPCGWS